MEGQGNNQVLSHSHAAINTADTMHSVDIGYIQCVAILGDWDKCYNFMTDCPPDACRPPQAEVSTRNFATYQRYLAKLV